MTTLNEILQNETETNIWVLKQRLEGMDMEKLLDYVQSQTVDSLFLKSSLYQFIRTVYRTDENVVKEALQDNLAKIACK